ncbi:MAG TPA: XdhC/CoxI family protein [Opitutaceae bacterium]
MKETLAIAQQLNSRPASAWALATLVDVAGSSYRRAGARLLVGADATRIGSISGGCLEADVVERARAVLASGVPDVVTYDTTSENDLVWGVGLGCHGVVRVLIERVAPGSPWAPALAANSAQRRPTPLAVVWQAPATGGLPLGTRLDDASLPAANGSLSVFREVVLPPRPLLICGAGDDAQPLARLAKELGWHVTVSDPRPAFATAARFPEADTVVATPTATIASLVADDPRAAAVIMTHHYVHDLPLLRALLPRRLAYLGLLGPKKRAERLLADVEKEGLVLTPEMRARLHAPIGLDLGGDTPEAVALAMIAEMQSVLNGRNARPLRQRDRPIHDDGGQ